MSMAERQNEKPFLFDCFLLFFLSKFKECHTHCLSHTRENEEDSYVRTALFHRLQLPWIEQGCSIFVCVNKRMFECRRCASFSFPLSNFVIVRIRSARASQMICVQFSNFSYSPVTHTHTHTSTQSYT